MDSFFQEFTDKSGAWHRRWHKSGYAHTLDTNAYSGQFHNRELEVYELIKSDKDWKARFNMMGVTPPIETLPKGMSALFLASSRYYANIKLDLQAVEKSGNNVTAHFEVSAGAINPDGSVDGSFTTVLLPSGRDLETHIIYKRCLSLSR